MEAGDIETTDDDTPELISAEGHRIPRKQSSVTTSKQGKSRTVGDHDLLRRIEGRIAEIYQSGQIQVVDGREIKTPEAARELARLEEQRDAVERKLGPTQVLFGFVNQVHLRGKVYTLAAYRMWAAPFCRAIVADPPQFGGPSARRDRLLWLLWNFRDKAVIQVGATAHKVRGSLVECAECGYRHRYLSRPRNLHGFSSCRRCSALAYRIVPETIRYKPFGKITRIGLHRRFRISKRQLDRVLAVPLP